MTTASPICDSPACASTLRRPVFGKIDVKDDKRRAGCSGIGVGLIEESDRLISVTYKRQREGRSVALLPRNVRGIARTHVRRFALLPAAVLLPARSRGLHWSHCFQFLKLDHKLAPLMGVLLSSNRGIQIVVVAEQFSTNRRCHGRKVPAREQS